MTTPERHSKLFELYLKARELDEQGRKALLDEACADDASLRSEVEALLAQDTDLSGFLEQPPAEGKAAVSPGLETRSSDRDAATKPSDSGARMIQPSIEGYEILRELHRGGQGVVYQAIQKATKRKVAIKVLLEGPYASKSAKIRFEREIELVAQLKHPNIITIFDSGMTPEGWQFYIMDYVRGLRLDHYVREKQLTLEESLSLAISICEAMQYAHHKGVMHRDLKPSNILVDAEGKPKILDFGLAKQLAAPTEAAVSLTQEVIGTLPYMSPEQARGNPDEIDTRTDIYALGVILYEMMTGHYPYPVAGQMADVLRHIAETPPTPPTRQWTPDSGVTRRSSKHLRAGKCPIDNELQTVILKTLAKERERRYQSAGELAKDIGHYLAGRPIEAKRDSGWYVLKKTVQRYKIPVGIAAAFLLLLSAFAVTISIQASTLADERNRANAERNRAHAFADALINASLSLENHAWDEAVLSIKDALGTDWAAVDSAEAAARAERAASLVSQGLKLLQLDRWDMAYIRFDEALRVDPHHFKALSYAAWWKKEEYFLHKPFNYRDPALLQESDELINQAMRIDQQNHALWNLKSMVLMALGQLQEAEQACRRVLELKPDYHYANRNLAIVLAVQGKIDEALAVAIEGAKANQEKGQAGKYDDEIWRTLATLQLHLGQEDALKSLQQARQKQHRDTRNALLLARLYLTLPGHIDEKKALDEARLAAAFTTLKDPRFKRVLAQAQLRNGQYEDAITNAEAAIKGGDLKAVCHLISAMARAKMGDRAAAAEDLGSASENWPEEFKSGGDVIVSAEKGLLWFDSRAEFEGLRAEAEQLLGLADSAESGTPQPTP